MKLSDKMIRRGRRMVNGLRHPSFVPMARYLFRNRGKGSGTPTVDVTGAEPSIDARFLSGPVRASAAIPPIVFQTWKSRSVIPDNYRYWRDSFRRCNTDFELLLWDDDDNRAFVRARFPWFLETYDRFPREIYRADAIRPLFLYLFGGFYADMDSECLRPLGDMAGEGDVILGQMGWDRDFEHSVPNALMASRPLQMFWLLYVAIMIEKSDATTATEMDTKGPETFTGPIALKETFDTYAQGQAAVERRCAAVLQALPSEWRERTEYGEITLLDQDIWYPIDWTNPIHRRLRTHIQSTQALLDSATARSLFPKSTLVTYWTHSW